MDNDEPQQNLRQLEAPSPGAPAILWVMAETLDRLRRACAQVAQSARHVRVNESAIRGYAASLRLEAPGAAERPATPADRETYAAFWLILDAINFGSGWFPTLRKRPGQSGYNTIAGLLREHFELDGSWSAEDLLATDAQTVAAVLAQDPAHELMELFAGSLRDLGTHVARAGGFAAVVDRAGGSAAALVEALAGWECFADTSSYEGVALPFLKRAQIVAADLHRAGVARFDDLDRLTMFADNLVPHVLRLDGVLTFAPELVARIEREELIEHDSAPEVEIRACALHAVELIVAASPGTRAADVDQILWLRGQQPLYKSSPRHRSRCTAY